MKISTAIKARTNFGGLLNEVYYKKESVIIERAGKPMAVLLPIEEYELLIKKKEKTSGKLKELREQTSALAKTLNELTDK